MLIMQPLSPVRLHKLAILGRNGCEEGEAIVVVMDSIYTECGVLLKENEQKVARYYTRDTFISVLYKRFINKKYLCAFRYLNKMNAIILFTFAN